MTASPKLKIWNGGGYGVVSCADAVAHGLRDESAVHVYACAESMAALKRMIVAYTGHDLRVGVATQLKTHWNEGAWGIWMEGITPEPGIWLQYGRTSKPVRVWPRKCGTCGTYEATAVKPGYAAMGQCLYEFTIPVLPSCVRASAEQSLFEKRRVWPEYGENCPAWSENKKANHE